MLIYSLSTRMGRTVINRCHGKEEEEATSRQEGTKSEVSVYRVTCMVLEEFLLTSSSQLCLILKHIVHIAVDESFSTNIWVTL